MRPRIGKLNVWTMNQVVEIMKDSECCWPKSSFEAYSVYSCSCNS